MLFTNSTKEQNRELCRRYPFLIPSNRWSGKRITDAVGGGYWPGNPSAVPEYDYEYTELDEMPDGWRIAFGEQLCEELREELEKTGRMDEYRIVQIKEKFGMYHSLALTVLGDGDTGYFKFSELDSVFYFTNDSDYPHIDNSGDEEEAGTK